LESWCGPTHYPFYCTAKDDGDVSETCALRGGEPALIASYYSQVTFDIAIIVFVISMVMIAWFVRKHNRLLKVYYRVYNRDRISSGSERRQIKSVETRHQFAKAIYIQALAYVFACLICQGSVLMATVRMRVGFNDWLKIYHLVFFPLQGFFNLLIFLGHKVYNIRRIDSDISIVKAIGRVFQDRTEPLFIFTQISLVKNGNDPVPAFDDGVADDVDDDVDYEVDGSHGNEDASDNEDGRITSSAADVISYDDTRNDVLEDDDNTSTKEFSTYSAMGLSSLGSVFSLARKSDAGLSTGTSSHLEIDTGLSTGTSSHLERDTGLSTGTPSRLGSTIDSGKLDLPD